MTSRFEHPRHARPQFWPKLWICLVFVLGAVLAVIFGALGTNPSQQIPGHDLTTLAWHSAAPGSGAEQIYGLYRHSVLLPADWIDSGAGSGEGADSDASSGSGARARPDSGLGLLLGGVGDAEAVAVNGHQIGQTGVFYNRARGYRGAASAQGVRVYPIPPHLLRAAPTRLEITAQSVLYHVPFDQGRVWLGDAGALRALADRLNAPVRLRDAMILALVLVCAGFGAASASGRGFDSRNRWMAPFFLALFVAVFPSTLTAHDLGLSAPVLVQLTEASPVLPFGLLHLAAITATRVQWPQWVAVGAGYLVMAAGYLWDVSLPVFLVLGNIQAGCVALAVAPSLWAITRAKRQGRRVSRAAYGFVLSVVIGTLAYVVAGPVLPPLWDPLGLMIMALAGFSLLTLADHMAWDRQALQAVTGQVLVAQDQERERLAKDLHDELSHRVTATRFRLEAALRQPQGPTPEHIRHASEELRELGLDISALVEGLRPAMLDAMTFADTIRHAGARWNRLGDLEVTVTMPEDLPVSDAVQLHVVRIVQEALLNVVRHAAATQVQVTLGPKMGRMGRKAGTGTTGARGGARAGARPGTGPKTGTRTGLLQIVDNGRGFAPQDTQPGMGLRMIEERAGLIGGQVRLVSQPGQGCRLDLEFPL